MAAMAEEPELIFRPVTIEAVLQGSGRYRGGQAPDIRWSGLVKGDGQLR